MGKVALDARDAVIEAGAVRFRPMLLTALAASTGPDVQTISPPAIAA